MNIKVVRNIEDPFLKSEWKRLESENSIFPQITYDWCATWWKYLSGKRKLHVVMVLDKEGKTVGIAPLCIERNFGIPIIRSFPVGFGDFYSFILDNNSYNEEIIEIILNYLSKMKEWRWVRFVNVSENNILTEILLRYSYKEKVLTSCIIANLYNYSWDEYVSKLSKNFRTNIRRWLRKIEKDFTVNLNEINNWDNFKNKYYNMVEIYNMRWADDYKPHKSENELACRREAFKKLFQNNNILYYELNLDGETVSYWLGFNYENTFYAWQTAFNPYYSKYRPGHLITALMIKYFISNGIKKFNFMAGDYNWKLYWSPNQQAENLYMFTSESNCKYSFLLNIYYHDIRDRLINIYQSIMRYSFLRRLSRVIFKYRYKITGRW